MPYSSEIEALYDFVAAQFKDNTQGEITPARARAVFGKLLEYVANLNTNQVKGALFRVPFIVVEAGVVTVPTVLIPVRSRILGMEVVAINGTDAGTAAAGVRADPITFKLLAHSQGTINALVDEQATTTATIKTHWVRTSGTDEQKIASYQVLPLVNVNVYKGEVYQHTFNNLAPAVTRLLEIRNDITSLNHPVPTGLDNDPYYKPFAPLVAATSYDDTAVRAQLDAHAEAIQSHTTDIRALENENTTKSQQLAGHGTRLAATESVASATKQRLDSLVANAPQALDTLAEIANQLASDEAGAAAILATQQQQQTQIAQNKTWIGALTSLLTNAKGNLVAAINELLTKISDNTTAIGSLPSLQTSQRGNLVAAINEVKNSNQSFGTGTGSSSLLRLNQRNSATDYQASVLAGEESSAIGQYSTVISGYMNVTRGHWSTVLGGSRNVMNATANGNQCFGIIVGSNICTTAANFCGIYNSSNCTIAAGCDYTTLIGCKNLDITTGSNQTYINNVLVGSNSPAAADLAASGTVIQFTTKVAQYGPLASGTFTLDAAGAVLGATILAFLTRTASAIVVPTTGYQLDAGAFVAGKAHRYIFHVERDGLIHYIISSY